MSNQDAARLLDCQGEGEIAATVGREAFEWLDAPVFRLGALDTPVPFARALEALYSPKGRLIPALRELLAY